MRSGILTIGFALFGSLRAEDNAHQWDANGAAPGLGGSGTWSRDGTEWDPLGTGRDDGSDPCVAPPTAMPMHAVFAGTGAAVTLEAGHQPMLDGLKFVSAGYELVGGPGSGIQLSGGDPFIHADGDSGIQVMLSSANRWTKRGPASLSLSGTNSFPNGLLIREGALLVRHAAALGNGPIQLGDAGSGSVNPSLVLDAYPTFVPGSITVAHSGSGVATLRSTTQSGGADATHGFSRIILQSNAVIDSNAPGSTVVSSIAGTGDLTITGIGKTTLPGPNPFSGNVTVATGSGGSLQIGGGSGSPDVLPDDGILDVLAESSVRMEYGAGSNETIGALNGSGTVWLPSVSSPPGNLLTVGGGDKSGSFEGLLTVPFRGLQRLVKIGTGTQSLTGTVNDFSGGVRILGGVLEAAYIGSRSLPSSIGLAPIGADGLILDGGTLRHVGSHSVTDRGFTIGPLGGTIEASGPGRLDFASYSGYGDPIALSGTSTPRTLTLGGTSTAANRINLVIPDKGSGSTAAATTVVKTGSGSWILSASNSFTGQLRIMAGTLSIPTASDQSFPQPMGTTVSTATKVLLDGGCLAMTAASSHSWNHGFWVGSNGGAIEITQPGAAFWWSSKRTAFHLDGTLEKRGPGTLRFSSSSSAGCTASAETDFRIKEGIVQFTGSVTTSSSPYGLRAIRAEVGSGGTLLLSSTYTLGGDSTGNNGSWGTIQLEGGTLEVNGAHYLPPASPGAPPSIILAAGRVTGTQPLHASHAGALITSLPSPSSSMIGNSGLSATYGSIHFDVADGDATTDLVIHAPVTGSNQTGVIKTGSGTLSLAGRNSFNGSTWVALGTLELAASGTLRFVRNASGVFNRVHGNGSAVFHGTFDIVTDTANLTPGSRWRLVETANATYSSGFSIPGFTREGSIHTYDAGGLLWTFNEQSGELSVAFARTPPDFASWANLIPDPGMRGFQDDPDGDGLVNRNEYWFGSMPHIPNGALLWSEPDGTRCVLRWNQLQTGGNYQLQEGYPGANSNWEPCPVPAAPDPVQTGTPPGWTRMRAVVPMDRNQRFFRIEAATP